MIAGLISRDGVPAKIIRYRLDKKTSPGMRQVQNLDFSNIEATLEKLGV